jgi:tripartite-type tricarboxylate transporter receptor subunit TctC
MRKFLAILLAFTAAAVGTIAIEPASGMADTWPQRSVRIITPFPVGTGGDVAARFYAEKLATRWGKPVIVENKPGADGIIAVSAFTGARDDHTLFFTNGGPLTSTPRSLERIPYDPVQDFVPISSGAHVLIAVSAPASLKIESLKSFVAYARSQLGKLNWGATPGALDYIVPSFLQEAGLDLTRVSYREIAPALQDLMERRIQLYASALATQLAAVQSGKVRVLAITNRQRTPLVDAPTAAEAGYPRLSFDAFLGFFGPRGMQLQLRDRISADVRAIGDDPALAERMAGIGLVGHTSTPAELSQIVQAERSAIAEFAPRLDSK